MRTSAWGVMTCALVLLSGCNDSEPGSAADSGSTATSDAGTRVDAGAVLPVDAGTVTDAGSSTPIDAGTLVDAGAVRDAGTVTPDSGVQTFSVTLDPITLAADSEVTKCVVLALSNTAPVHVQSIHTTLTGSSELVVYTSNASAESRTPTDCLMGDFNEGKGSALTFTQKANETLTLPAATGFTFGAGQLIRLKVHAIEFGAATPVSATVSFTTQPDADFQYEAGMLLVGTQNINIPAASSPTTTGTFAVPTIAVGSKLLVVAAHTHALGTEEKVRLGTSLIYTSTTPNDPSLAVVTPPRSLTSSEMIGLDCSWANTGGSQVRFGFAFGDEQCFVRMHYAPATGSVVCTESVCLAY